MFFKKKNYAQSERFEGFRIHTTYDCQGRLKTQYFDIDQLIDVSFIEYLKPFGYPTLQAGRLYEIQRDHFFTLVVPLGQNTFQVRFDTDCDPSAHLLLFRQVQRAIRKDISPELVASCPENAISIENNTFSVDLRKCTYCLQCV